MSWPQSLLTRRNALLFLAGIFFLIAWNREVNLLYGMFALISATVIVSVVLPRFALNGIEAFRTLPAAAFEGEEIEISVTMANRGRASRFMVEAVDAVPAAPPHEREPLVFAGRLAGGEKRSFTYRLPCYKRGFYSVGPLRLRSAYPLGIAWSEREGDPSLPTLQVYPSMFEITSFPLLATGSLVASGMESLARAGGSDDFFGTREYRRGDSLRHIHWPSTARHDRLIVKEFEVRASTEATLLLDLHRDADPGEERESVLEYSVRIAASIAGYALGRGHTVQLAGFADEPHLVAPGRGRHHLALLLDALARVAGGGAVPYHEAMVRAADLLRDGSTAVLFFCGGESVEEYLYPLGILRAKRVRPVAVYFERESFSGGFSFCRPEEEPLARELLAMGVPVYFVARGSDLRELFQ
ncbi:MAG: hypothetical protein A2075_09515 [Geobacteraceae bacterium GWC2_58_44]|nr:MAG: hypothetical protein A2075_09515 [Geobacteraceae bacterium GWC2_58_44]HBG08383.1 hypothetical protein [Geobacter sp.]